MGSSAPSTPAKKKSLFFTVVEGRDLCVMGIWSGGSQEHAIYMHVFIRILSAGLGAAQLCDQGTCVHFGRCQCVCVRLC